MLTSALAGFVMTAVDAHLVTKDAQGPVAIALNTHFKSMHVDAIKSSQCYC